MPGETKAGAGSAVTYVCGNCGGSYGADEVHSCPATILELRSERDHYRSAYEETVERLAERDRLIYELRVAIEKLPKGHPLRAALRAAAQEDEGG